MIGSKVSKGVWLTAVALVAVAYPTWVSAQAGTASGFYPDDIVGQTCGTSNGQCNISDAMSGTLRTRVQINGAAPGTISGAGVPYGPGVDVAGEDVAVAQMNAVCAAAVAAGWACTGVLDNVACAGAGCCAADNDGAGDLLNQYRCTDAAGTGFRFTQFINAREFFVTGWSGPPGGGAPDASTLKSLHLQNGGLGNTLNIDLLKRTLLRVDANGNNGMVTIRAWTTPPCGADPTCQNPASPSGTCGVNPTGLSDAALHQGLRNCVDTLLGSGTGILHAASDASRAGAAVPGDYTGNFVEILHPASLQALEVKGAPGQRFILEDVEPTPSVPTLSEWGMGVLVAILLLTGIWMIKRRRRFQTA